MRIFGGFIALLVIVPQLPAGQVLTEPLAIARILAAKYQHSR